MALPTIPGSSISLNQVNVELGLSGTASITMNDAAVRTLFGKAGSGTTISMSDGSGKSNFTVAYAGHPGTGYGALANNTTFTGASCGSTAYMVLNWKETGVVQIAQGSLLLENFNTWGTPTGGSPGSNYWIRFTRTGTFGDQASTASTGWQQLNTARDISVSSGTNGEATYTIEIASDSGGSNILTTRTGINLVAFDECQFG